MDVNIHGMPRRLRTENLLRRALLNKDQTHETANKLAAEIFRSDWTLGTDVAIAEQMAEYDIIYQSMLRVRRQTLGGHQPERLNNLPERVATALHAQMGRRYRYDWDDVTYLDRMIEQLESVNQRVYAEHLTMRELVLDMVTLEDFVIKLGLTSRFVGMVDRLMNFQELNDQLAGNIAELRRFGVKPAIFADGMMHGPDQAWIVQPPPPRANHFLALTSLVLKSSARDLELKYKQYPGVTAYETIPSEVGFDVGRDGQLYLAHGLPVREVLNRIGTEDLYEYLRFIPLIRIYDLVVPIETVQKMPGWPGIRAGRIGKVKALAAIPAILIPRLRALDKMGVLESQLVREVETAALQTQERARRRHGVVGHVRVLPTGKSATPQARQRAFDDLGIILADNETYVRPHQRGRGEAIKAHEARKVPSRRR